MAVHAKNTSFAEEQRQKIMASVSLSSMVADNKTVETPAAEPAKEELSKTVKSDPSETGNSIDSNAEVIKTVTSEKRSRVQKPKDVLIGIHVTEDERAELRKVFCSNGFSLATAYRSAMAYLKQDLEQGKAFLTQNGEVLRR